ncbi:hypothetical protein PFMC_05270, partial [Plasmodium falciparum CAMP/Malaysia]
YEKQKDRYKTESENYDTNNYDNGFSAKLKTYKEAKDFLQNLEPCSKNNSGEDKLDFSQPKETFRPAKDCKPCSKFKINCENGNCGADTNGKCNGKTDITANHIGNERNSAEDIDMVVSNNSGKGFKGNGLKDCEDAGIFKGIRKDEWECDNVCGYEVCKPKVGNGTINDKHIIQIKALVKRWLEFFIDDYNRIRKKLMPCIENGEANICINDCEKKCKCVKNWIDQKREEWDIVKKRFLDQYKSNDSDNSFPVRSFLEGLIPQITDARDQKKLIKLSKFGNSCGCSADAHAQKNDGHQDAIDCMLQKLQKKIDDCKNKHNGQTSSLSVENTAQCKEYTPPDEEEDLLLEEETENQVKPPEICPTQPKETKKEEEDDCKRAEGSSEEKSSEETDKQKPDQGDQNPPAPAPKAPPKKEEKVEPPSNVLEHPAVIPSLVTSTLAWSVGIGFAAFTYFYLK